MKRHDELILKFKYIVIPVVLLFFIFYIGRLMLLSNILPTTTTILLIFYMILKWVNLALSSYTLISYERLAIKLLKIGASKLNE